MISPSRQIDGNGQTGDLAQGSQSEILVPPANAHEGLIRGKYGTERRVGLEKSDRFQF